MFRTFTRLFLFALICVPPVFAQQPNPHVAIKTDLGVIDVELDAVHAPNTVANFLKYVQSGAYVGASFHRTVTINPDNQPKSPLPMKIEVIQADVSPEMAKRDLPPIPLENTSVTGIHHLDGTISMGRDGGVDSATSQFFICINDQPGLDFGNKRDRDPAGAGFAAFGHVVRGMDIVRRIQNSPATGQKLTPPIMIHSAALVASAATAAKK